MRLILAILIAIGLAAPIHADEHELWPELPKATGEPHPEGNEFWRENHMVLLLESRDMTLREGIREVPASIASCVACHAVRDESGLAQPVTAEGGFCQVCHAFVAVKPDCFVCHRDTPPISTINQTMATPEEPNSIEAYLTRVAEREAEELAEADRPAQPEASE